MLTAITYTAIVLPFVSVLFGVLVRHFLQIMVREFQLVQGTVWSTLVMLSDLDVRLWWWPAVAPVALAAVLLV